MAFMGVGLFQNELAAGSEHGVKFFEDLLGVPGVERSDAVNPFDLVPGDGLDRIRQRRDGGHEVGMAAGVAIERHPAVALDDP